MINILAVQLGDTIPRIVFYPNYRWFDQRPGAFSIRGWIGTRSSEIRHCRPAHSRGQGALLAPCRFATEIVIESRVGKWKTQTFEVATPC